MLISEVIQEYIAPAFPGSLLLEKIKEWMKEEIEELLQTTDHYHAYSESGDVLLLQHVIIFLRNGKDFNIQSGPALATLKKWRTRRALWNEIADKRVPAWFAGSSRRGFQTYGVKLPMEDIDVGL